MKNPANNTRFSSWSTRHSPGAIDNTPVHRGRLSTVSHCGLNDNVSAGSGKTILPVTLCALPKSRSKSHSCSPKKDSYKSESISPVIPNDDLRVPSPRSTIWTYPPHSYKAIFSISTAWKSPGNFISLKAHKSIYTLTWTEFSLISLRLIIDQIYNHNFQSGLYKLKHKDYSFFLRCAPNFLVRFKRLQEIFLSLQKLPYEKGRDIEYLTAKSER